MDAIIIVVNYQEFTDLSQDAIASYYKRDRKNPIIDVKGVLDKKEYSDAEWDYWSL